MAFKSVPPYVDFFRKESTLNFKSRGEVYEYLEEDVFNKEHFREHITQTAKTLDISYMLAYDIITNYLTDILYELDKAVSDRKKSTRISVHSYFSLKIGFMKSLQNKKMFLEKFIKI